MIAALKCGGHSMACKNVVFIDDDPTVRVFAEKTTKYLDFEFTFHEKISDALEEIESLKPKLVVVDMSMSNLEDEYEEFAGIEITEYLRSNFHNDFPILILTGHDNADLISKCLRSGADDYFVKSHEFSGLIKRIASWLVIDYSSSSSQKKRDVAARALEKLVLEKGLLNTREWRKVVMLGLLQDGASNSRKTN